MARRQVNSIGPAAKAQDLVEKVASFATDPLGFVMFAFPWGVAGTRLADETGPDEWQVDLLLTLSEEMRKRDAGAALGAIQAAVASGHGIGKTALVSWVILWFMSTRADPSIVVTANTLGQLSGKTWRELAKWHRMMMHADWFLWTATTFMFKEAPETHKALAVPWTKERAEAFAGTHERNVLMLFDEASAIADEIWTTAEGAMTTKGAIWLVFGNPTRNSGRFRECWRQFRHRWIVRQVDSRKAKMADKAQIQKWIDDYGEDSDFVRVRVRGEFPREATTQFISSELVDEARRAFKRRHGDNVKRVISAGGDGLTRYKLDENDHAPRIMTVDVARFGSDQTVFGLRQGKSFIILAKFRELTVPMVAHHAAAWIKIAEPDHVVVDAGGVGGGVADLLEQDGYDVVQANFGMVALDKRRFFNRRAEMWWKTREWLAAGGMIVDDSELVEDLTAPEYGFSDKGDKLQIETKDDMRARGVASPDCGDALAMTFWSDFAPVRARRQETMNEKLARAVLLGDGGGSAPSWMSR